MSQHNTAVPAIPGNVISFPFPPTKDPDKLKEICYRVGIGLFNYGFEAHRDGTIDLDQILDILQKELQGICQEVAHG